MDLNRISITGRAVRHPDIKTVGQDNTLKIEFRIATQVAKERAIFINITCFGPHMLPVCEHVTKGKRLGIEGRLNITSYEKDGKQQYYTEVIADRIIYLDKRDPNEVEREANL